MSKQKLLTDDNFSVSVGHTVYMVTDTGLKKIELTSNKQVKNLSEMRNPFSQLSLSIIDRQLRREKRAPVNGPIFKDGNNAVLNMVETYKHLGAKAVQQYGTLQNYVKSL